jgi:exopolysaccharide biosynthesis polyprenyl glycosylphosphotransferase
MRLRLFFSTILLPVDYAMLVAAALAAYFLRFESGVVEIMPAVSIIPYNWYLLLAFTIPLGWLAIFAIAGLYKMEERRFFDDIPKIIFACSTGIVFAIALIFFKREFFASRFVILAAWALSVVFVSFGRATVKFIHYQFKKSGRGVLGVVIIGTEKIADILAAEYMKNPVLGRRVETRFPIWDEFAEEKIKELQKVGRADEVVYAGEPDKATQARILHFCEENHLRFKYSADFFSSIFKNLSFSTVSGVPLVEVKRTRLDGWARVYKRIFDIAGSLFLITVCSPVMAVTALIIKLDRKNPGPVFWSRLDDGSPVKRVGEGGKMFDYFKFRSMKTGTHNMRYNELAPENSREGTPMVKIKNDPRVTAFGKFIRRYSLDELPEFFLVLKGEMSLVGPRPHLPEEVAKYRGHHKKVLSIKPGITGLAQISGRADLDFEEEVGLDNYYIENWSPGMDIYILLKTPFVVFSKRGAY